MLAYQSNQLNFNTMFLIATCLLAVTVYAIEIQIANNDVTVRRFGDYKFVNLQIEYRNSSNKYNIPTENNLTLICIGNRPVKWVLLQEFEHLLASVPHLKTQNEINGIYQSQLILQNVSSIYSSVYGCTYRDDYSASWDSIIINIINTFKGEYVKSFAFPPGFITSFSTNQHDILVPCPVDHLSSFLPTEIDSFKKFEHFNENSCKIKRDIIKPGMILQCTPSPSPIGAIINKFGVQLTYLVAIPIFFESYEELMTD